MSFIYTAHAQVLLYALYGLQGVHIDDMKRCGIMHSICRQRSNISFYRMWLYIYIRSQKKRNDYYSIAMAAMPPCGQPIRQGKEFLRIRVQNPDRHHLPGSRNSLYQSTMDIYIYMYRACIPSCTPPCCPRCLSIQIYFVFFRRQNAYTVSRGLLIY